jgi:hypothetical protein
LAACPQESLVVHVDSQHSPQYTADMVAWADGAASCAVRPGTMLEIKKRPRNAMKPRKLPYTAPISVRTDLRLSSPTFIGQNGVELRIGASFKMPLGFRFAPPHFSRRRVSHNSPAFVASGVNASYMGAVRGRKSARVRNRGCPQEVSVVHADSHQFA